MDAVAMLVRPEGGRQLLPEDTFAVQFKASSVRVGSYKDPNAARWVVELGLPFFIGSVRLDGAAIHLYPTHDLFKVRPHTGLKEVHLHLDGCSEQIGSPEVAAVSVGPPIHSWSADSLADTAFPSTLYPILKGHILAAQRNIQGRAIGHFEPFTWQPGHPPQLTGDVLIHHGSDGRERSQALASLVPPLRALLTEFVGGRGVGHLPAVFGFIKTLRAGGIDPDPGDLFMKMALAGPPTEDRSRVLSELTALGMSPCSYWWQGQALESLGGPDGPPTPDA